MAGDERHRGLDHAPHRRASTAGRCASPQASRSRPTTPTARSPSACRALGGELLVRALDERARRCSPSRTTRASTYAEKIGAADRLLDPAPAAGELERRGARAAPAHRRARRARGRDAARRAPRARVTEAAGRRTGRRLAALARRPGVLLLRRAATGVLELLEVAAAGRQAPRLRGGDRGSAVACVRAARRRCGRETRPARRLRVSPRCCAACSSRARTPTARCTARRRRSTRATGRWRCAWRTGRSSARGTLDHLIERLRRAPAGAARRARAGGAAARAATSCCSSRGARPRGRRRRRSSWPRRGARRPRPRQRGAAARRARGARRCWRRSTTTRPSGGRDRHSHPEWIARLWWEQLGAEEARALMACDNEPAEVALRANTLRHRRADALARRSAGADARRPGHPRGARARGPVRRCTARALWRAGRVHGAVAGGDARRARALRPAAGRARARPVRRARRQDDAPGGADGRRRARSVAVERHARPRARRCARTARGMRAGNVRVEVADARRGRGRTGRRFDRVLVDPPCSGLGTLQARAGPALADAPEDVARARAQTQAAILRRRRCALSVRAACWSTLRARSPPTENERQIAAFLDAHPDFTSMTSAPSCRARAAPRRGRCAAGPC